MRTAEERIAQAWDYMYGHDGECALYQPGLRLEDEDECGCSYEWDSETIEIVSEILFGNHEEARVRRWFREASMLDLAFLAACLSIIVTCAVLLYRTLA